MNPVLEKRLAIFALLVFTGVLSIASYYNGSDSGESSVSSPFDKIFSVVRYLTYGATICLLLARLKTVIRPALRDPFMWGLMIIVVSSFMWSDFPDISQKQGRLMLLTTLFGLYLASRFSVKELVRIFAVAVGIAAVFSLLYSLAFRGAAVETGFNAGCWRGPFLQKNIFARFLVAYGLPILLVALGSRKHRFIWWTVFGIAVLLIQLTNSKSALLIILTLTALVPLYKALRSTGSILVPFLITIILIGGSVLTFLVENWEPFLFKLGKDPSLTGRTYIWEASINLISQRPWLGYGFQAFFADGGAGEKAVWDYLRIRVSQAHNGFINVAAELGLLGLMFFVLSMVSTYIRGITWVRFTKDPEDLWPLLYVTYFFMYNITESTNLEVNSLLWIFYSAAAFSARTMRPREPSLFTQYPEQESLAETT
ncbi:O-antigen ligase family protein [Planktothrix sp. FACHB-1375]|uniref:O-antigen ligase family protein n=1 Tax=Aerosakkonema funiforme FACHB-1375 TaxID=2949571 RepID=A0A926VGV4_9CYAN|nr:O-antigen ligase family protein [Aerosakkonema funiforme FACHB-1375]